MKSLVCGVLFLGLAACGAASPVDQAANKSTDAPKPTPEQLAGQGDINARRHIAVCSRRVAGCSDEADLSYDIDRACAWRTVVLASQDPNVNLADADAYREDCGALDQTEAQKAYAHAGELIHALYGKDLAMPLSPVFGSSDNLTFQQSAESMRVAVNESLKDAGDARRLPSFAKPIAAVAPYKGQLAWKTCAGALCLRVVSPVYGGGAIVFKVSSPGAEQTTLPLVARLATSALQQPSQAQALVDIGRNHPRSRIHLGTACWGAGRDVKGDLYVGATLAPC